MSHHRHPNRGREQIHLSEPSVIPLVAACSITLALVGLVLSWWFVAVGAAVFLVTVVRWALTVREEVESLPSERR